MFSDLTHIPAWVPMTAAVMVGAAMLLAAWRVIRGPHITDRIIALDLLGSLLMAQFVLLAFTTRFLNYLDVAATFALISFLATVAFARYLERRGDDR